MTGPSCCVKECKSLASTRQPLKLAKELTLHVPLCTAHSAVWEDFARRLHSARARSLLEHREVGWLLDAALALCVVPNSELL
jgi:hypothetical protein